MQRKRKAIAADAAATMGRDNHQPGTTAASILPKISAFKKSDPLMLRHRTEKKMKQRSNSASQVSVETSNDGL